MHELSAVLLDQWRAGDESAARQLYERYAERLIALAKTRLSLRLARRVEPEDLIQSVFRSFFTAGRDGRFVLRRPGDLWRLLLGITRNKIRFQAAYHAAARRAMAKECASPTPGGPGTVSHEPTPEEAATLADLLEQALARFDPTDRRIIELRLQGYLLEEIVPEAGRCRLTVIRVLDRFKQELGRLKADVPAT